MIQQHVEPIDPEPAAILLRMWAMRLCEANPDLDNITTRLHDLANSLLSQDEPFDG